MHVERRSVGLKLPRDSEPVAMLSYADAGELTQAVAALCRDAGQARRRRVEVIFGDSIVQRRTLTDLPRVRSSVLRELVQAQQRRYFRRNGRNLVTDARWTETADGAVKHVTAVAVDEWLAETVIEAIGQAGLAVERASDLSGRFRLIPEGVSTLRLSQQRRQASRLLVAALMLWLSAVITYWVGVRARERALDAELARIAPAMTTLREARRRLGQAEGWVSTVDAMGKSRDAMRLTLSRILISLPDSSYLTSLTLGDDGTASLSGTAREATGVAARIEKLTELRNVRIDGTPLIVASPGRRWERFAIRAGDGRGVEFR